ncbi:MAG: DUF427 domain-containing protein [Nocardioidaceae bacterium]
MAITRVEPGPGQESVWDYPRPPRLEHVSELVEVELGGTVICSTRRSLRVLETSHPPTYYLPFADFTPGSVRPADGSSYCEWKGEAAYLDLLGGDRIAFGKAWHYPEPTRPFLDVRGHLALYPAEMDECRVDGEVVRPQEGGFYGGWITSRVVGPFKGPPGSRSW